MRGESIKSSLLDMEEAISESEIHAMYQEGTWRIDHSVSLDLKSPNVQAVKVQSVGIQPVGIPPRRRSVSLGLIPGRVEPASQWLRGSPSRNLRFPAPSTPQPAHQSSLISTVPRVEYPVFPDCPVLDEQSARSLVLFLPVNPLPAFRFFLGDAVARPWVPQKVPLDLSKSGPHSRVAGMRRKKPRVRAPRGGKGKIIVPPKGTVKRPPLGPAPWLPMSSNTETLPVEDSHGKEKEKKKKKKTHHKKLSGLQPPVLRPYSVSVRGRLYRKEPAEQRPTVPKPLSPGKRDRPLTPIFELSAPAEKRLHLEEPMEQQPLAPQFPAFEKGKSPTKESIRQQPPTPEELVTPLLRSDRSAMEVRFPRVNFDRVTLSRKTRPTTVADPLQPRPEKAPSSQVDEDEEDVVFIEAVAASLALNTKPVQPGDFVTLGPHRREARQGAAFTW
jgi:hypothetical protein